MKDWLHGISSSFVFLVNVDYFDKFDAVDVRKYYTTIIQDPFITLGLVHDN